jgi:hypothetical protein
MAILTIANKTRAKATYNGGVVEADIGSLPRKRFFYNISCARINGINANNLADYADALRKVARHVAKIVGKEVKTAGTRIDPDEPTQLEGQDSTITYRVFPRDPRWIISFTAYALTGQVKARVPEFTFADDLPSVMQLAFVCEKASLLMKKY